MASGDTKVLTFELETATVDTVTVDYYYTVTAADVEAGKIVNKASIKAWFNGEEPSIYPVEPEIETPTGSYKLSVEKVISSITGATNWNGMGGVPATVKPNSTINWTITVRNSGTVQATGVKLTDHFEVGGNAAQTLTLTNSENKNPNDFTVPAKTGDEDGKVVFTASYTVPANAEPGTTITNSAVVGDEEKPTEPDTTIDVEKESVKIEKTVSGIDAGTKAKVGDTLTYKIKVTNTGNVDLTGLKIKDTFNGNGVVMQNSNSVQKGTDGTYTFTIDSLAKGADTTITYTYKVVPADAGTKLTNTAVADVTTENGGDKTETEVDTLKISSMEKTLVMPTEAQMKWVNNVKVEDDKLVVIENDQPITLLYKITITGDVGAKFKLTDNGSKVVGDSGVTLGQETMLTANTLEVYVTMEFTKVNGEYVNTANGGGALTNKATVTPGQGTETTDPAPEQPESKAYTVTVRYVDEEENGLYEYRNNWWTRHADYNVIVPEGEAYDVSKQAHGTLNAVVDLSNTATNTVNVTYVLYDMEVSPVVAGDDIDSMFANGLEGTANSDITITLKYKQADIRYTVEYYKDGAKMEEAPAKAITGGAARYGETVTLTAVEAANVTGTPDAAFPTIITDGQGTYVYDEARPATVTVTSENAVIKVYYLTDNKGGDNGPDGIPDAYEAFVEYKSVAGHVPVNGIEKDSSYVSSISETHDLRVYTEVDGKKVYTLGSDGNVQLKTAITAAGKTAVQQIKVGSDNYAFDNWTTYGNRTDSSLSLAEQIINGVKHGQTYTFTANYAVDNWKVDPDGTDSETGGDGIPDKYQAIVRYVSNDTSAGSVDPTVQVFTSEKVNGAYQENWSLQVTAESTATAKSGYAFAYWSAEPTSKKGEALSVESLDAEFSKEVIFDSANREKTFYAFFLKDEKGPDGKPDKTPDDWQVFVNFKADNGGKLDPAEPATQVFDYYQKDANGYVVNSDGSLKPVTSIALTAAVTAVPDSGMSFEIGRAHV